jgi:hypothetical protein
MVEDTAAYFSHFLHCLIGRFKHWKFPCSMQDACYNFSVLYKIQVYLPSSQALSKIAPLPMGEPTLAS